MMLCTVHAYETNRTMIRILCIVRLTPLAQFCSVQPFVFLRIRVIQREKGNWNRHFEGADKVGFLIKLL